MITPQNQIHRTLTDPASIETINHVLNANREMNRSQLADYLCDQYEFLDPRGEKQRTRCLTSLRKLEDKGYIVLPKTNSSPRKSPSKYRPKRLGEPIPLPVGVPDKVEKMKDLELVLVESEEATKIWNELIHREHPMGSTTFFGRQIRYLVQSEHGWLGAIGFSAATLNFRPPDKKRNLLISLMI